MPAKIITLSQKDQDLLRLALAMAVDGFAQTVSSELIGRIKDLKERIL